MLKHGRWGVCKERCHVPSKTINDKIAIVPIEARLASYGCNPLHCVHAMSQWQNSKVFDVG